MREQWFHSTKNLNHYAKTNKYSALPNSKIHKKVCVVNVWVGEEEDFLLSTS